MIDESIIHALDSADYVIVPREPTQKMLDYVRISTKIRSRMTKTDIATLCRKCHNRVLPDHAYRFVGRMDDGALFVEHVDCNSPEAPERPARTVPLSNSRY